MRVSTPRLCTCLALLSLLGVLRSAAAEDFDRPPIRYSDSTPENSISRLQAQLDSGQQKLAFEPAHGYLKSLLQNLQVPVDSQTLVFSKSSVQARYISPQTPRALYFNDDVYVGFCVEGRVLEISAVDPQLGAVFYSLDQKATEQPRFVRHGEACLSCHSSSRIGGIPGHIVRSHIVDQEGHVMPAAGIHQVDYTTPLARRWGGWYVTGKHGKQSHLGNYFVHGFDVPQPIDNSAGQNVLSLADRIDVKPYLVPDSDIVALMVMEHQTLVQNRLTNANFATRQALEAERQVRRQSGQEDETPLPTTTQEIRRAGDELIDALLLVGEVELTDKIEGTSGFAANFAKGGPRDSQGRSLRELDLSRRLFRYPCSYLIYSEPFRQLPAEMRDYVWQRLSTILSGENLPPKFSHLSPADRQAIREILSDTISDLPPDFGRQGA